MIAGNITNSEIENEVNETLNKDNEWLQHLNGTLPYQKRPALIVKKPEYPVQVSSKQKRGIGNG